MIDGIIVDKEVAILVVEDDLDLAEWMHAYFSKKQFIVDVVHTGNDAISFIQKNNPDIVILDYMLPDIDGISVCKAVRPFFKNAILMVTARDEEIDEVLGLEMGADEYLIKPVRARALLTRIQKYLERRDAQRELEAQSETHEVPRSTISFGGITIDIEGMRVTLDEIPIDITTSELELLWYLGSRAGEIVSRDDLIRVLRGFDYDGFDRSIDLKISRLRKKLGDTGGKPTRIKTIWGKGYLFVKDAW